MFESSEEINHRYEVVQDFKPTMDIRSYYRAAKRAGSVLKLLAANFCS
jgi:hypothetical protein